MWRNGGLQKETQGLQLGVRDEPQANVQRSTLRPHTKPSQVPRASLADCSSAQLSADAFVEQLVQACPHTLLALMHPNLCIHGSASIRRNQPFFAVTTRPLSPGMTPMGTRPSKPTSLSVSSVATPFFRSGLGSWPRVPTRRPGGTHTWHDKSQETSRCPMRRAPLEECFAYELHRAWWWRPSPARERCMSRRPGKSPRFIVLQVYSRSALGQERAAVVRSRLTSVAHLVRLPPGYRHPANLQS